MLERFFKQPKILARLKAGPFGPHLLALVSDLEKTGYAAGSIQRHVRAAEHFGSWIEKQGVKVADVDEATLARYIQGLGRRRSDKARASRLPQTALGLRHCMRFFDRRMFSLSVSLWCHPPAAHTGSRSLIATWTVWCRRSSENVVF